LPPMKVMMKQMISRFTRTATTIFGVLLMLSVMAIGQQSPSEPDVVMKAMQDELARSVSSLKLKDLDKPYFIEYEIADVDSFTVSAAFGGLLYQNRDRGRGLSVDVRVGSYDFDNEPSGYPTQLVIEDDYDALRHELWLATDAAYRQAVETMTRKRAFRKFPMIKQSSVSLQVQLFHKYMVNSEGTKVRRPSLLVSLEANAYTQAADGMWLSHGTGVPAASLDQLPSAEEFAKAIRKIARELTELQRAPVLSENYLGPVLFTGQASAEMFSQLLASELCSQRPSVGSQQEDSSSLFNRINRRVLPPFLSVFDDPTQQKLGDEELLGTFAVDDQGVPARKVSLVEEGILKNLLMSRRPRKNVLHSTGHGRSPLVGGASTTIGNLFIQPKEGKSYEE